MASTDAHPVPIRAAAFRVTFPMRVNTGALNSGAAGVACKVSKDAGTFAATTNSPTEIATSSGMYYLDLTATEMTAQTVGIWITSSTSGAVPTSFVLYPQQAGDIPCDVQSVGGSTNAALHQQLALAGMQRVTVDNTVGTISASSIPVNQINQAAADYWKDRLLLITDGALVDQMCRITAYAQTGAGGTLTVTGFTSAPANGVNAMII